MKKNVFSSLLSLFLAAGSFVWPACTFAETQIGSVSTTFKLLTPNDKIVVEAFEDPMVKNSVCYISRPVRGGLSGAIGIAEEKSDSSIACRQIGPISDADVAKLKDWEVQTKRRDNDKDREVFRADTNLFFKATRVVRFFDAERNVIIYMSFARELVNGSPKSALSVVPVLN